MVAMTCIVLLEALFLGTILGQHLWGVGQAWEARSMVWGTLVLLTALVLCHPRLILNLANHHPVSGQKG